jgi:UDP-N-acetylglucosamine 2-epimerase (non-hydrolysing)
MKKVMFIFGTRPEAIKMAPVVEAFKNDHENFETLVTVTAQHRQMLDQVLELFKLVPDYDLNIMKPNQTLEELTGKLLLKITEVLKIVQPDLIFVQGDTTTTFVGALAAFYQKIPVAHIEAGLRTSNKYSPFPEEINRRMTSSISSFHFPPTLQSRDNLLHEGVGEERILVCGNTVIDALQTVAIKFEMDSQTQEKYFSDSFGLRFEHKKTLLVTGHRRESFGQGFENVCNAIRSIALSNDIQIVYPVHLNPNVQEPVNRILGGIGNVHLIPPQDYVPFVYLMKCAHVILSDSGGVQEEAPSLGKPVLVMRDTTERQEGVESGTARLVGTDTQTIIDNVESLLNDPSEYDKMAQASNPYGDGKSSKYIHDFILDKL